MYNSYDEYISQGEKYEEQLEKDNWECELADRYNDDVKCGLIKEKESD